MASKSSRLEAVNAMLSAAGEAPVASLTTQAGVDSTMADQILTETERAVQAIGWYFNTRERTFPPDTTGFIQLPGNVIRIDTNDYGLKHLTIRSGKLFDMKNGTDVFDADVTADFVELLDWEDLPETARQYIIKKAARIFVDRFVADPSMARLARQDEAETLSTLQREEMQTGNYRIFGPDFVSVIDRGKPLDWISGSW